MSSNIRYNSHAQQKVENDIRLEIDFDDHISFIEKYIRNHDFTDPRRSKLLSQCRSINKRKNDEKLYLAVLGEFSSGKSTFINALLRRSLLKSSPLATTAAATLLEHGTSFTIRAEFKDGTILEGQEKDFQNLVSKLVSLKGDIEDIDSLQDLLRLLTADKSISEQVKKINVTYPADFLSQGICIIDTPGISGGMKYTSNHAAITEKVVEEHADVAVILIPATAAMSKTLVEFLATTANPFLHRCIFVVTALDRCEESLRPEIMNYTRTILRDLLDREPVLFEAAALTMLVDPNLSQSDKVAWQRWRLKFQEMEEVFVQEMVRQRALIISEKLVRLIRELICDLNDHAKLRKIELENERKLLAQHSVARLDQTLTTVLIDCKTSLSDAGDIWKKRIDSQSSLFMSNSKDRVTKRINEGEWNTIDAIVKEEVPAIVTQEAESFRCAAVGFGEELERQAKESFRRFQKKFQESYQTLKALDRSLSTVDIDIQESTASTKHFNAACAFLQQVDSEDKSRAKNAAGGAAAVGFLVGGPVGALVGAALGGVIGFCWNHDIDKHRAKIRQKLLPDIEKFIQETTRQRKIEADRQSRLALNDLDKYYRDHLDRYGKVVEDMISNHQLKQKELQRLLQQAESEKNELGHRDRVLEKIQEHLTSIK